MSIKKKELKKLWGLAAGRCSKPDCNKDCVPHLNPDEPTIIGEMAHIIADSESGPRGQRGPGDATYDNLILLCPTHHREIDKASEDTFPVDMLHRWKQEHEERVRDSLDTPKYNSLESLCRRIKKLLVENKSIWQQFGPESEEAQKNPVSNLKHVWDLRKLDTIVPNNSKIVSIIQTNKDLFSVEEYKICEQFKQHAQAFEHNCYERTEGVPQFPDEFEELIENYV